MSFEPKPILITFIVLGAIAFGLYYLTGYMGWVDVAVAK